MMTLLFLGLVLFVVCAYSETVLTVVEQTVKTIVGGACVLAIATVGWAFYTAVWT